MVGKKTRENMLLEDNNNNKRSKNKRRRRSRKMLANNGESSKREPSINKKALKVVMQLSWNSYEEATKVLSSSRKRPTKKRYL